MSGGASLRSRPGPGLLLMLHAFAAPPFRRPMAVAALGLAAAALVDLETELPMLCGRGGDPPSLAGFADSARILLEINPPVSLALAWLAMLVAMMTPLIAVPLAHVGASSLVGRRGRAAALFLLGYFGVWWLAGLPLLALALLVRLAAGGVPGAFAVASLLALAWSASPIQQAAQNRAHRLRRIGLFGVTADRDCLVFGAALGGWCLATCWAWMLVPLFVPDGHIPAMVAVSAIIMAERLRGPGPPRWRAPVLLSGLARGWARPRWQRERA